MTTEDEACGGWKPQRAREKLEDLGYTQETWGEILGNQTQSHEIRALVTIALGTRTRLLGEVYMEERVKDGLPADRLAERLREKKQ